MTIRERHTEQDWYPSYPSLVEVLREDISTLLTLMDESRLFLNIFQQILNLKEPNEAKNLEDLRKQIRELVG